MSCLQLVRYALMYDALRIEFKLCKATLKRNSKYKPPTIEAVASNPTGGAARL